MVDKVGREIKVGSIIAYGHAMGHSAGIRIGKVCDISEGFEVKWGVERDATRITVIGVDGEWLHRSPRLNERKGTLLYPNRVIVLDEDKVPAVYMDLLRDAG